MDMTNLSAVNTLQGLAYYTNNSVSGILFQGGLIAFFIVLLIVLLRNEQPAVNALSASSWSCFIIGLFLWLAHLIPAIEVLLFLFLSGFSVLYMYASPKY